MSERKKTVWECNECGSQEYNCGYSEEDMEHLRCGSCGGDEWHKAFKRTEEQA